MQLDAIKALVQPALEQDFDALYEEYLAEGGAATPDAFLGYLASFQLISAELASSVSAKLANTDELNPDELEPENPTDESPSQGESPAGSPASRNSPTTASPPSQPAAETHAVGEVDWSDDDDDRSTRAVFASEVQLQAIREQVYEEAGAEPPVVNLPSPPSPESKPEWDFENGEPPDETKAKRTMFRRMTGGWRETGEQPRDEAPQKQERQRRRRRDEQPAPPAIPERYDLLGMVGEGAMGRILLAADKTLHRKVAFKQMSEEIAEEAALASKFTAEAQITAQLDHPNIVPIYNLESSSSYTMKLIRGETLDAMIKRTRELWRSTRGKLDEDHSLTNRLELFLKVCDALAYAHARGIIHRDLKPENIMVGMWGEVYVMDWGIARQMTRQDDVQEHVFLSEMEPEGDLIIGTPGYMSPEQAEGKNDELDGHSDQYALGLILFELIALKPAVTGKAALKIVMRHQDGEKDPFTHAFRETIPRELHAIVHRATAKNPAYRYPSVEDFGDDIRRYLRGEAILARPDGPWQSLLRWMGRHRELTVLSFTTIFTISVLTSMLLFAMSQYQLNRAERREQQVSNLVTTVARQSSLIDGQFLKYEGLLSLIAATATDALTRSDDTPRPIYYEGDYKDPATAPPDVEKSERYGMAISLDEPAFIFPRSVRREAVEYDSRRLSALSRHFNRVLLRSKSEEAATFTPARTRRLLADVGVPVAWAYVGLANGLYQVYPGHAGYSPDFDARERPWYQLAATQHGPTWGAPGPDDDSETMGLVLTCAQGLYDQNDQLLGVAGIDVTFDYIIEALLEAPEFQGIESEAYLLDPEGRIVVRSSSKGKRITTTLTNRALRMPAFQSAEVVEAVKAKRSGYTVYDDQLIVYNRMNSIGWTYVVSGDVDEMLGAME